METSFVAGALALVLADVFTRAPEPTWQGVCVLEGLSGWAEQGSNLRPWD